MHTAVGVAVMFYPFSLTAAGGSFVFNKLRRWYSGSQRQIMYKTL